MKQPLHIKVMLFVAILLTTDVMSGYAQLGWDMAGVEAFIDEHKATRSLIEARAIVEQGNKILHSTSNDTNGKYRDVNIELDKYTKAFDVIDIVFNTVSTGFNVYHTVDNVSDKVGKYKNLLTDFNDKIVRRGKMEPVDTLLLTINAAAIEDIYEQSQSIYGSITAIAAYSSGKLLATSSNINQQILHIDACLNRINEIINKAYFETYTYIRSRTSFWNRKIFTEKSKNQICTEAFGRWRIRSQEIKPNG